MRRFFAVAVLCTISACGGDTTPLPPMNVGAQWLPLMMDTTGNIVMRRVAMWADTSRVTVGADGYVTIPEQMLMDMKIGGMSMRTQTRTQIDCAGRRQRTVSMDSMSVKMKGVALPDSLARQAVAQQGAATADTTWRAVPQTGMQADVLAAACAKRPPDVGATKSRDSATTPPAKK